MLVHIAAGLLCLVAGPVAMLARPKGGALHRRAGRLFLWLMLLLAVTAAALLVFRWNPFFFALSVFSFYLAFSGWRVLRRKCPYLGKTERALPLDWLAAITTVAVGAVSVLLFRRGTFGEEAAVVLGTLSFAVAAALYDLWRFACPRALAGYPILWLLEHLTKVSGAYIAVACAFSGTIFTHSDFLPVAIAQTWPAAVGVPLMLFVANRYWRRSRRTKDSRGNGYNRGESSKGDAL